MDSIQVVWFKRDLRTRDHWPLVEAARRGRVLPLCIVEPAYWQQPDVSRRQWRFVRQSLRVLERELETMGGGLVVRVGDAVAVLAQLHAMLRDGGGLAGLWSHEETGNAWTFARDRRVADWARQAGVPWREFRQDGVVRRLASRDLWAAHWETFIGRPILSPPARIVFADVPRGRLPMAPGTTMPPDDCPDAQQGGRDAARELLAGFLAVRGRDYARGLSSPISAAQACSRLSPHLAWGTVSVREVATALRERQAQAAASPSQAPWGRPLAAFASRLAWQSHFMQKLESEPRIEFDNMHPALDGRRDAVDAALLEAWAVGRSGFPFVDACMRMLAATGWINFRMRAMLAAFACYHLWQPWRAVGLVLAQRFVDYEPGIHWSQMQMQSGSTGINAFRIYNPVKQSMDHDPRGLFIRRWVPELARVPPEWIHQPWLMSQATQARAGCMIGREYPLPVVDHARAAREARQRLMAAYRTPEARAASQSVFVRHGSRKRGQGARDPGETASPQLRLFDA